MLKLSIIVPAYNVENFLEAAVHSIDHINNDIEIIIVNDGSTDHTLNVAKKLQCEISQIKIINQKNSGLSQSRNNAVRVACGKYLMFLDADDRYKNEAIKSILDIITSANPDIIIYNVEDYDIEKGKVVKVTEHDKVVKRAGSVYWNKVYKKQLFEGVVAPQGHLFEDSAVIPFIVAKAYTIILADKILYSYSVNRKDSIMAQNYGINFSERVYALQYLNDLKNRSTLVSAKKKEIDDYILTNIMFAFRNSKNLSNMDASSLHSMIILGNEMFTNLGIKYIGIVKYVAYKLIMLRGIIYEKNTK